MLKRNLQIGDGSLLKHGPVLSNPFAQVWVRRVALPIMVSLAGLSASPAAANPIGDCFERIAVAARHVVHHRQAAPHHVVHRVHPHPRHRVVAASPTAAYAYRMRYILRPRACEEHPVTAMSLLPGTPPLETSQRLLAELAGPTPPLEVEGPTPPPIAPGVDDTSTPGPSFPGGPPTGGPTVTPNVGGPETPGVPGQPPVVPPENPVVAPVMPPVTPPVDVPGGPGGFPPILPVIATPPFTPAAIPEPVTWAMLILGFFGLGAVLRRARARSGRAELALRDREARPLRGRRFRAFR
jgi:hypothetical protein